MLINNNEKFLIIIDLGKTLLLDSNDKTKWEISKLDLEVINSLKDLGHEVVLATGRIKEVTFKIYKYLQLDGFLILENGKEIYDNQGIMIKHNSNWNKSNAVEYINKSNLRIISFGDGMVDEELLNISDFPFAMKSGHPKLVADYPNTISSNNDSGVGRTLIKLLNLKTST